MKSRKRSVKSAPGSNTAIERECDFISSYATKLSKSNILHKLDILTSIIQ